MSSLSKRGIILVLLIIIAGVLIAHIRAQRILQETKHAVSQEQTRPSPAANNSTILDSLCKIGLVINLIALLFAYVFFDLELSRRLQTRFISHTVWKPIRSSSNSAKNLPPPSASTVSAKASPPPDASTPRASGISADLQEIALQYTQVTGKGLIGGYTELLRQNTQASLEAKGVAAAVRRLDNRDRIVNRLAQSIRAEDGLKETVHQYELNEILREQKHKAVRSGSPMTPSLPPAAAPASLPSAPVQPYSSPDRLEGLALHGVLIYRTEGQESFARFAAALSHDLGRNEAAVVTRRMDEMLSKLDSV